MKRFILFLLSVCVVVYSQNTTLLQDDKTNVSNEGTIGVVASDLTPPTYTEIDPNQASDDPELKVKIELGFSAVLLKGVGTGLLNQGNYTVSKVHSIYTYDFEDFNYYQFNVQAMNEMGDVFSVIFSIKVSPGTLIVTSSFVFLPLSETILGE